MGAEEQELLAWAAEYFASERRWWRTLRETGEVSDADAAAETRRWLEE